MAWEYSILVVRLSSEAAIGDFNVYLAKLGGEGWEISAVLPSKRKPSAPDDPGASVVVLKRPRPAGPSAVSPPDVQRIGFKPDEL